MADLMFDWAIIMGVSGLVMVFILALCHVSKRTDEEAERHFAELMRMKAERDKARRMEIEKRVDDAIQRLEKLNNN